MWRENYSVQRVTRHARVLLDKEKILQSGLLSLNIVSRHCNSPLKTPDIFRKWEIKEKEKVESWNSRGGGAVSEWMMKVTLALGIIYRRERIRVFLTQGFGLGSWARFTWQFVSPAFFALQSYRLIVHSMSLDSLEGLGYKINLIYTPTRTPSRHFCLVWCVDLKFWH